jgi:hypothetical protein
MPGLRHRRYVGDAVDPASYETSYDPTIDNTGPSLLPTVASTTTGDVLTELATWIDTGEWIPVSNPGSSMSDVLTNAVTGQPTANQMQLAAQAAAAQMAQAGGTPTQVTAAYSSALKYMQQNPAPDAGFLGLSTAAWITMGAALAVLLVIVKK